MVTLDEKVNIQARSVFSERKVALFIVTYNAERQIRQTLERIPAWCRPLFAEIYVIDDSSTDRTYTVTLEAGRALQLSNFSVMKTPENQGYGGNQKIGYSYAIEQNYDIIILLHGDGQYPPEYLPTLVAGYTDHSVDAVFGSRMINRSDALRGGMPIYKWVGNQILTRIENAILGTKLSEFHSGYRSYRLATLKQVPFHLNSNAFHFDTDIIIQLHLLGGRIKEIPMPTHYGDEECHVDGMRYAWNCLKSVTKSRLHQAGFFFQPNFESVNGLTGDYQVKSAPSSLHTYILRLPWVSGEAVADLGANTGVLAQKIAARGPIVTAVDNIIPKDVPGISAVTADLNGEFSTFLGSNHFNTVVALDVIEHLYAPEQAAKQMIQILKPNGILCASTANIGYIIVRIMLLFGWFNYGKKGILDRTHHRLFTLHSFQRLLEQAGFRVIRIRGFGPPIIDAFGNTFLWRSIDQVSAFLARTWPTLFAFNFLIIAKKVPTTVERTIATLHSKRCP